MSAGNPQRFVSPRPAPSLLRRSGSWLCLLGVVVLGYVGYVLLEARIYQAYQSWQFEEALKNLPAPAGDAGLAPSAGVLAPVEAVSPAAANVSRADPAGVLVGRIELERIGLDAMILQGVGNKTLRRGVGHVPGTALPGLPGNVAIAGHRDTFFRGLQHVRTGDEITLTTLDGVFRYRVGSTLVVEARDTWVLEDTGGAILTLVTCYPFQYVGPAPRRFIVRAQRISDDAKPALPEK